MKRLILSAITLAAACGGAPVTGPAGPPPTPPAELMSLHDVLRAPGLDDLLLDFETANMDHATAEQADEEPAARGQCYGAIEA